MAAVLMQAQPPSKPPTSRDATVIHNVIGEQKPWQWHGVTLIWSLEFHVFALLSLDTPVAFNLLKGMEVFCC